MNLWPTKKTLVAITLGSAFALAGVNTAALAQETKSQPVRRTWEAGPSQGAGEETTQIASPRARRAQEFGPRITKKELTRLKTDLKADETQAILFDAAYEGYREAVQAAAAPMQNQQPMTMNLGDGGTFDQEAMHQQMEVMRAASTAHQKARDSLQDEFLNSVHQLLDDHQQPLWGSYQKGLRRRTTLKQQAALTGEGVDLVELTNELEITTERLAPAANVLNQYATELDDALTTRNESIAKMNTYFQNIDPMANHDGPDDKVKQLMKRTTRQRLSVVGVNQRFVTQIAASLDREAADAFQAAFNETCFPRILRDTRADRYITKLNADEELTSLQHDAIDRVAHDYKQNLVPLNQRLIELEWQKNADQRAAINRAPDAAEGDQRSAMAISIGGGSSVMSMPQTNPETRERIGKTQDQKNDLVNKTIDALFAALSPEEQKRLPKPKPTVRFTGGNLAQMFGENANINFDGSDLPEGFDLAELLEGIQLEIGDSDGNVTVQAVSIGQIEQANGEEGEGVGVFIAIEAESDEEGDEDETEEEDDDGDGG